MFVQCPLCRSVVSYAQICKAILKMSLWILAPMQNRGTLLAAILATCSIAERSVFLCDGVVDPVLIVSLSMMNTRHRAGEVKSVSGVGVDRSLCLAYLAIALVAMAVILLALSRARSSGSV